MYVPLNMRNEIFYEASCANGIALIRKRCWSKPTATKRQWLYLSLSIAADSRGILLGYTFLNWETRHVVRVLYQMLCYSQSTTVLAWKVRLAGKAKPNEPSARRGFGKEGAHGHHRC